METSLIISITIISLITIGGIIYFLRNKCKKKTVELTEIENDNLLLFNNDYSFRSG